MGVASSRHRRRGERQSLNGRPELTEALGALDAGEADLLLAAKLDRVSRSVLDFAALMARADRRGGGGPTTRSEARERCLIGQRTRDALAARRTAGVVLGRPRTLDPALRERIIAERDAGRSLRTIAAALTAEGVPTAQGAALWYASTVRHVALEAEVEA